VVIPLSACISRPDKEPGDLVRHNEAVACACGDKTGPAEDKLAFLAGLSHDLAKSAADWQRYIRSGGAIKKGPPHAPLGSALFAFWAEDLIPHWASRADRCRLFDLSLDWVRMIYRHHGALDDLDELPPWRCGAGQDLPALLPTCDLAGLDRLVQVHFPEYGGKLAGLAEWLDAYDDKWKRRYVVDRPGRCVPRDTAERHLFALRLPELGARLIFADRSDAADWERGSFTPDQAAEAVDRHASACRSAAEDARENGASEELIRTRTDLQARALERYRANGDTSVFTLLLPTGYGKTLTGLRVALEAVKAGRCERLIYVAPYISILSQSANIIEGATGQPVFVHHHLSILGEGDSGQGKEDRQREDHQRFDLMDTWQAPMIATTFNQLFRALFPARAQECLRIPALDHAFIFIDEPQVVEPRIWSAFLRALAVVARQRGCQVLFATATLPPLEGGLGADVTPTALAEDVRPSVSRFVISAREEPWDLKRTAREARERFEKVKSVAVILNTVRDAVEVFERVAGSDSEEHPSWFFLAAMMLPGHKARLIQTIDQRLKDKKPEPTGVICTQVLEAGVDLSFRALLRARPIFSSVAQAAGRANRHASGQVAEVIVFPFVRDGVETRKYVYKDGTFVRMTDLVLRERPELPESELADALNDFYQRSWNENDRQTSLQLFDDAAKGRWSALAGEDPFGGSYPQIDVFIPGAEQFMKDEHRVALGSFGVHTAQELFDAYAKGLIDFGSDRRERFLRRKRLSALLQQCAVAVPVRVAELIAEPVADRFGNDMWLWQLKDGAKYCDRTGLAHYLATSSIAPDLSCVIL
jgi:CRISPR-associated endonuclease/helicase Cas3